jgi:ParB family chromosome partitioning protein
LNLPHSVQAEVRKGTLSFGHARALLALPDPEAMAGVVQARGLTVRQTEALASRAPRARNRPAGSSPAPDIAALERRLTEQLGFQARVTTDRQGGVSVLLGFTDIDQLEAWMASLP